MRLRAEINAPRVHCQQIDGTVSYKKTRVEVLHNAGTLRTPSMTGDHPSTQVFKIDLATFTSESTPLRLHVIVRCLMPRIMGAPVSFMRLKALLLVSAYHVAWASSGKRVCAVFRSSVLPPTMITACAARVGYWSFFISGSWLSLN